MDRLTFSVIWELSDEGKVLSQWAGRTVIRTCAKLAYEHAQAMIEGTFDISKPPVALSSPHTWPQVPHSPVNPSMSVIFKHHTTNHMCDFPIPAVVQVKGWPQSLAAYHMSCAGFFASMGSRQ